MALEFTVCEVRWDRYPKVSESPHGREWLKFQSARGLAPNTLDAYGRNLDAYLGFLAAKGIAFDGVVRSTVGLYIRSIADLPVPTVLKGGREPMSLFELQEWLGHRLPSSTQRYAKITPTKPMKSYTDAGYFARTPRAIEVLIDQEKVRSSPRREEAWKFYDLGHCTYDFFDQCPHRMVCAKCSFYMPKGSTSSVLLEGKKDLLRMRH